MQQPSNSCESLAIQLLQPHVHSKSNGGSIHNTFPTACDQQQDRQQWHAGQHGLTWGWISRTLRPLLAFKLGCSLRVSFTALTTCSYDSGEQFLKCTLTQNLLCSTAAPGMFSTLSTNKSHWKAFLTVNCSCRHLASTSC